MYYSNSKFKIQKLDLNNFHFLFKETIPFAMILEISLISFIKNLRLSSLISKPSLIRQSQYFDSFADFKLISLYLKNSLLLDEH